jgi:hypothetical protein
MSFHRENVIWQSPDGTWNRGFYTAEIEYWKEDYDPEWDVDYNFDEFEWLSSGHPTEEAAHKSWTGSNPGGHSTVSDPTSVEAIRLEKMAADYRAWERENKGVRR